MNRPTRLSRRAARRLLSGRPGAHAREQRLVRLLDVLAEQDTPGEPAVPAQLLDAFTRHTRPSASSAQSAVGGRQSARSGARSGPRIGARRLGFGRALTAKALFVLALTSASAAATVAAAAADALPAPAQLAVHDLFGSWGVPAPTERAGRPVIEPSASAPPTKQPPLRAVVAQPAAPTTPAATARPAPRAPSSHPAMFAHCLSPDVPRRHRENAPGTGFSGRANLGAGTEAGPACADESGPRLPDGGEPPGPPTGGDPAKRNPGGWLGFPPGRPRGQGPRTGMFEH